MHTAIDCTVVAVYENQTDAQSAVNDLQTAGLSPERLYISSAKDAETVTSSPAPPTSSGHESFGHWLKSLFGPVKHAHQDTYQQAYTGGKHIVSVEASESQVHAVRTILNRFSPMDVHTDDYGAAHGVETPDTYNYVYQGSASDVLNAKDELAMPVTTTGSVGIPGRAVRVYPKERREAVEQADAASAKVSVASKTM